MKKQKILENYFASNLYSNNEILKSIEETKKEFAKKIVDVDINLNEFGIYVVTYYFKTEENIFQKVMVKLKKKFKKKNVPLLQSKTQYGKYKQTRTYKPY